MRKSKADRYRPGGGEPTETIRRCDSAGCEEAAAYRAPRSRSDLRAYYWFCLDHVREYNSRWNYFAGLSDDDVERIIQNDTIWERPTWPMGSQFLRRHARRAEDRLRDAFRAFGEAGARRAWEASSAPGYARLSNEERRALRALDLDFPVTLDGIKARYKELVKRHHPDANGGDRSAEDKLKYINIAYRTLRQSQNF